MYEKNDFIIGVDIVHERTGNTNKEIFSYCIGKFGKQNNVEIIKADTFCNNRVFSNEISRSEIYMEILKGLYPKALFVVESN